MESMSKKRKWNTTSSTDQELVITDEIKSQMMWTIDSIQGELILSIWDFSSFKKAGRVKRRRDCVSVIISCRPNETRFLYKDTHSKEERSSRLEKLSWMNIPTDRVKECVGMRWRSMDIYGHVSTFTDFLSTCMRVVGWWKGSRHQWWLIESWIKCVMIGCFCYETKIVSPIGIDRCRSGLVKGTPWGTYCLGSMIQWKEVHTSFCQTRDQINNATWLDKAHTLNNLVVYTKHLSSFYCLHGNLSYQCYQ